MNAGKAWLDAFPSGLGRRASREERKGIGLCHNERRWIMWSAMRQRQGSHVKKKLRWRMWQRWLLVTLFSWAFRGEQLGYVCGDKWVIAQGAESRHD